MPLDEPKTTLQPEWTRAMDALQRETLAIIQTHPENEWMPRIRNSADHLNILCDLREADIRGVLRKAEQSLHPRRVDPFSPDEDINIEPIRWMWDGVIRAGGGNLLIASPKVGKSALMMGMVGAMATGATSYLGRALQSTCPPVFVVGTDQPFVDWEPILIREGLFTGRRLQHPIKNLWDSSCELMLDERGIKRLRTLAVENPGALFVLDSYRSLIAGMGINENDSNFADPARALLRNLTDTGATWVIIHHSNKSVSGGNAISASSGNNSLPAAASCCILMNWLKATFDGSPQQDFRIGINQSGRLERCSMVVELTDDGWISHGDGDEAIRMEHHAESVAQLGEGRMGDAYDHVSMRSDLGCMVSVAELAGVMDRPLNKVQRYLGGLVRKGLIIEARGVLETGGRPGNGYFTPWSKAASLWRDKRGGLKGVKGVIGEGFNPLDPHQPPLTPSPRAGARETVTVGTPVELFRNEAWCNGWLVKDNNPDAMRCVRVGSPNVTVSNLRWGLDVRACSSPFGKGVTPPEGLPELVQTSHSKHDTSWIDDNEF